MNTTTIECPSCNRRICIALKPPFCSFIPIGQAYSYLQHKEYRISDLLYVHEELIKENELLREQLYGKYDTSCRQDND